MGVGIQCITLFCHQVFQYSAGPFSVSITFEGSIKDIENFKRVLISVRKRSLGELRKKGRDKGSSTVYNPKAIEENYIELFLSG